MTVRAPAGSFLLVHLLEEVDFVRVLGIETSCDDTGVADYDDERGLLAHKLASQVETHQPYGGVVPEPAARDHI